MHRFPHALGVGIVPVGDGGGRLDPDAQRLAVAIGPACQCAVSFGEHLADVGTVAALAQPAPYFGLVALTLGGARRERPLHGTAARHARASVRGTGTGERDRDEEERGQDDGPEAGGAQHRIYGRGGPVEGASRNSPTRVKNRSGASQNGMWPASGRRASRARGRSPLSSSATSAGSASCSL